MNKRRSKNWNSQDGLFQKALLILLLALAAMFSSWARAATSDDLVPTMEASRRFERLIEISGGVQLESRTGWLTRDRSGIGFAGSAHLFNPLSGDGISFLEFQFGYSEFKAANSGGFPFEGGERTKFLSFALIPSVGFYPMEKGNFFFGIGPAQYKIWQDEPKRQEQTYGTFVWQVGGRYSFSDRWGVIAKLNYSDLDATVNGKDTFLSNTNLRLELALTLL